MAVFEGALSFALWSRVHITLRTDQWSLAQYLSDGRVTIGFRTGASRLSQARWLLRTKTRLHEYSYFKCAAVAL